MRVLLAYPEVPDLARFGGDRKEFPPFGVLYLSAVLEDCGHEVEVQAVSPDSFSFDLSAFDVVGVSVSSSATSNLLHAFVESSPRRDETPVLLGGVHCHFYPEVALADFPEALAASYGEAESYIDDLVRAAAAGDVSAVPGIWYRTRSGELVKNRSVPNVSDLDRLPLPARHLLPQNDIVMTDRLPAVGEVPMAHVLLSRGCPYHCSFCAVADTGARYRSGKSAAAELAKLVEEYGIKGFAIVDDNFVIRRSAVQNICTGIAPLGLKWSALSRVDTVSPALLSNMAQAGCVEIKFGIESGSEALLRAMNKRTTRDRIRKSVRDAGEAGINVKAFIIHGFPGENAATTDETISLLDELSDGIQRVSLFRFVPLPGTEAYENADQHGITMTHRNPARWDGDWSRYHIHHNDAHWWGSDEDFVEMDAAYRRLREFIEGHFAA